MKWQEKKTLLINAGPRLNALGSNKRLVHWAKFEINAGGSNLRHKITTTMNTIIGSMECVRMGTI